MDNPIYTLANPYNGVFTNVRVISSLNLAPGSILTISAGASIQGLPGSILNLGGGFSLSVAGSPPAQIRVSTGIDDIINGSVSGDLCLLSTSRKIMLGSTTAQAAITVRANSTVDFFEVATVTGLADPRFISILGANQTLLGVASAPGNLFSGTTTGDGCIRSTRNLLIGSVNNGVFDTVVLNTLRCPVLKRVPSAQVFNLISPVAFPNLVETPLGGWTSIMQSGEFITYSGTTFTNNTGRTIATTISYSVERDNLNSGRTEFWFQTNAVTGKFGWLEVDALYRATGTTTLILDAGETFQFFGFHSGGGADFVAAQGRLSYVIH